MKHISKVAMTVLGLAAACAGAVCAGTDPGKAQWYEKAAVTVGPVEGAPVEGGSLLTLQEGSSAYMEGNSTLHKYRMNAQVLRGTAVLKTTVKDLAQALKGGKVRSMSFVVPVSAFKSQDSGLDKNAYAALKSKENPEFKFVLTGETLKPGLKAGAYVMTAKGTLAVAGVTVPILLTADTTIQGDQVRLQGTQKLKFTDFKIKPPSASIFIVTVTCDDAFEVHYDVTFAPAAKTATIPRSLGRQAGG